MTGMLPSPINIVWKARAMTTHREISFFRGDTLNIRGTVLDLEGQPLPLVEGVVVEWAIMNEEREVVQKLDLSNGISVINANDGLCLVRINTLAVQPGRYFDQLRVVVAGDVSTVCSGSIVCREAPLAVAAQS